MRLLLLMACFFTSGAFAAEPVSCESGLLSRGSLLISPGGIPTWKGSEIRLRGDSTKVNLNKALLLFAKGNVVVNTDTLGVGSYVLLKVMFDIRQSFLDSDPDFHSLRTIRGRGYVWDDGSTPGLQVDGGVFSDLYYTVQWQGKPVDLTPGEFRVVSYLLRNIGQPISVKNIFEIYADKVVNKTPKEMSRHLEAVLGAIRGSFRKSDPKFDRIKWVLGEGLAWIPEGGVSKVSGPTADGRMVEQGDLIIMYDGKVFWKGRRVILTHHKTRMVWASKDRTDILLRVLLNLVDHRDHFIKADEIYEDAWVNKDTEDGDPSVYVSFALMDLRRAFERVDHEFSMIRTSQSRGFTWDDGERLDAKVYGRATINEGMKEILWDGKKVYTTPGRFRIVARLIEKPGHRYSFETIYKIYSDSSLVQKNGDLIDNHMASVLSHIRTAFRKIDPDFNMLRAVDKTVTWNP